MGHIESKLIGDLIVLQPHNRYSCQIAVNNRQNTFNKGRSPFEDE